jgi:hypothetical protein
MKKTILLITTSVACAVGPSVPTSWNSGFLPKPGFLEFIWIFSGRNYLKINISHILDPNLTKQVLLNPAHQDLCNNTKGTFQFLRNFQLRFNLIQWRNHSIFKNFCTTSPTVMEPSPCAPPHLKPPSWVDLICKNKTNKLSSFIDRCHSFKTIKKRIVTTKSSNFISHNIFNAHLETNILNTLCILIH